jgi:hypothetical protein
VVPQWAVGGAGSRQQVERVEKEKEDCGLKKAGVNERREQGKCGEQEQSPDVVHDSCSWFMDKNKTKIQKVKRGTTSIFFFNRVFEFPLSRNAQKRNKKIDKGKHLDARTRKTIAIACLSSPYREALNQRNKKVERKKIPRKNISPVVIFGNALKKNPRVFELPLPRNTQIRTKI